MTKIKAFYYFLSKFPGYLVNISTNRPVLQPHVRSWQQNASFFSIFLQLVREVPLAEDGLLRLHLLGLSEELPINCADTLDLIERMVLRAAMLRGGTCGVHNEL